MPGFRRAQKLNFSGIGPYFLTHFFFVHGSDPLRGPKSDHGLGHGFHTQTPGALAQQHILIYDNNCINRSNQKPQESKNIFQHFPSGGIRSAHAFRDMNILAPSRSS